MKLKLCLAIGRNMKLLFSYKEFWKPSIKDGGLGHALKLALLFLLAARSNIIDMILKPGFPEVNEH